MKKFFIAASLFLASLGTVMAQDQVSGSIYGSSTGSNWTMNVNLTNSQSYCAFQMDIKLPAGVSASEIAQSSSRLVAGDPVTIDGKTTQTNFVIASNVIDEANNILRVIAYNFGNNEIKGNSGDPILDIKLESTTPLAISDVKAQFSNVLFVSTSELKDVELSGIDAVGQLEGIVGDVNGDGIVNTIDLARLINVLLQKSPETVSADVNQDGDINSLDLARLINILLNK